MDSPHRRTERLVAMFADMKHDAIVNSGIPILARHDIPAELIPPDSQVEIQGKFKYTGPVDHS